MIAPARALLLAISLLTRVPVRLSHVEVGDHGRALMFFPVVGLAIGVAQIAVAELLLPRLSALLTAVLVVVAGTALTGALHLDGVADTCDAAGGGRGERERMLVIMKDSRIGAHGATGLFLLLLVRVVATADVLRSGAHEAILLGPCIARALVPALVVFFPYLQPEGAGSPYDREGQTLHVIGAALPLLAVIAWTAPQAWRWLSFAIVAVACVVIWALRYLCGLTGDVYGACIEVAEATLLVAAATPTMR